MPEELKVPKSVAAQRKIQERIGEKIDAKLPALVRSVLDEGETASLTLAIKIAPDPKEDSSGYKLKIKTTSGTGDDETWDCTEVGGNLVIQGELPL